MSNILKTDSNFQEENLNPQIATLRFERPDAPKTGSGNNMIVVDFGKKNQGDLAVCSLKLTGEVELLGAGASCGCTVPSFRQLPEEEGGGWLVTIQYDSYKIHDNVSVIVWLHSITQQINFNIVMNQ